MSDLISRANAMGAVQDHFNADGFKGYDDGQKMMDRIKELPSAKVLTSQDLTEPNKELKGSDLIRREDAIEAVHKYFVTEIDKTPRATDEDGDEVYTDMPTVNFLLACNKELSQRIKSIPSAEAVQGEWIKTEHCLNENGYRKWIELECPFCGFRPVFEFIDDMNFCPNCGCKMQI